MKYPHKPGFKARATAKAAADAMKQKALPLRERVWDAFKRAGKAGSTADEIAEAVGSTILAVRPRVSELAAMGRLQDTLVRRANRASGRHAIVWRAK